MLQLKELEGCCVERERMLLNAGETEKRVSHLGSGVREQMGA